MPWVVDTCVLLDVLDDDPVHGRASAACLDKRLRDGLVVCPVSFIELAPAFLGDEALEVEFLSRLGVAVEEPWLREDTRVAHRAWSRYIERRRMKGLPKRPLADVLIGAFASRFDGLITRNGTDFRAMFRDLKIVQPA